MKRHVKYWKYFRKNFAQIFLAKKKFFNFIFAFSPLRFIFIYRMLFSHSSDIFPAFIAPQIAIKNRKEKIFKTSKKSINDCENLFLLLKIAEEKFFSSSTKKANFPRSFFVMYVNNLAMICFHFRVRFINHRTSSFLFFLVQFVAVHYYQRDSRPSRWASTRWRRSRNFYAPRAPATNSFSKIASKRSLRMESPARNWIRWIRAGGWVNHMQWNAKHLPLLITPTVSRELSNLFTSL